MTIVNTGSHVETQHESTRVIPASPWAIITQRFDSTVAKADQVLNLLVGDDGQGGYLGAMAEVIANAPNIPIIAPTVDTGISFRSVGTPPTFNKAELVDYPDAEYPDPLIHDVPAIDISGLTPGVEPVAPGVSLAWTETPLSTDVYEAVWARIQADLQSGATGLDPEVEAAIFDRAMFRQQAANAKAYRSLNDDLASRGFQLPSGALVAALTEFNGTMLQQEADVNNNILVTSADLAQKNSQFVIERAIALDDMIRRSKDSRDATLLDRAKTAATLLIQEYGEKVRGFIAGEEAKKIFAETQLANLRAVLETNKGNVEVFKTRYDALATRIDAANKKNTGLVSIYSAEMQGFSEGARAITGANAAEVDKLRAEVEAADLQLKAAIAEAQNALSGYSSESGLRSTVAAEMSRIAAQTVASAWNAVNASASLGYSGSESRSDNRSLSASLSESHNYEHDPLT